MFFTALTAVIGAYLLGSVNFAVLFTKAFTKKDVRNFGSGNAGSTNALRVGGKLNGALTFICDFLKGTAASLFGKYIFEYIYAQTASAYAKPIYGAYFCAIACLLGHVFPLFFGFKGGKGVATGAGVFLAICPLSTLLGISVFAVVLFITKYVSVSSIAGTLTVVITALIMFDRNGAFLPQFVMAVIMALIVIVKHKGNIKKLMNGTENKI